MKTVEIIKSNLETNNNNLVVKNKFKRVAGYGRVSTLLEEQEGSFKSQVGYYTEKIKSNSGWKFIAFYGDKGISGTQTKNRTEFLRMIQDAVNGKIDMIITKSISRFARNTIDTLKYVRLLRKHNVDVYFEKENIHTLDISSEMFLTLFSAFAQGESESISANVKLGIRNKMEKGELIGNPSCYGFRWNKETKELEIYEKEAKVVRLIFDLYIIGKGMKWVADELNKRGIKTQKGGKWYLSAVGRILQNEKYVGDLLLQKSYVLDPISHKKVRNFGEKQQYYVKNHHKGIVSREVWDKAQEIRKKRAKPFIKGHIGYNKYSRLYTFSSKIQCGWCGNNYARKKNSHGNRAIYWACMGRISTRVDEDNTKSMYIREDMLKEAFVKLFNRLVSNDKRKRNKLYEQVKATLNIENTEKDLKKLYNQKNNVQEKLLRLIDMKLEDFVNKEVYEEKEKELNEKLEDINKSIQKYSQITNNAETLRCQLEKIENIIKNNHRLTEFDEDLFEILVDKIIIGAVDETGKYNANIIRFILKTDNEYDYKIIGNKSLVPASYYPDLK